MRRSWVTFDAIGSLGREVDCTHKACPIGNIGDAGARTRLFWPTVPDQRREIGPAWKPEGPEHRTGQPHTLI